MSRTFSLVCHETKQYLWVGQGSTEMTTFYSGEPETMKRLAEFLKNTKGKSLVLMCDDTEGSAYEDNDYEDLSFYGSQT